MALSQDDLTLLRDGLSGLSLAATKEILPILRSLQNATPTASEMRRMKDAWIEAFAMYGDMSAALGSDAFVWQAESLGIRTRISLASPDVDEATSRFGWALGTANPAGNARILADELVKQPFRDTIAGSAVQSDAGWARVPNGATCAFCVMVASRGAVYSEESRAKRFHGSCDCTVVLVRGPQDYPRGYDPDALVGQYTSARKAAGSGDTKAILAEMRRQLGVK